MSSARRVSLEPAFLLHHHPWRDTSRILELLTRTHGRVSVVARGSRQSAAATGGALQSFTACLVSWSGRGEMGYLTGVERLAFANTHLALDIDGAAGVVAKTLAAVFGPSYLQNKTYVGLGLALVDGGMSYPELVRQAVASPLFAELAGSRTHADFVRLVYQNVIGTAPSNDELNHYVGLLETGVYTSHALAYLAAETPFNAQHINLTGLAGTGIEFTPWG